MLPAMFTRSSERPARSGSSTFYVPQLDGLRFCAFFGVFTLHANSAVLGGGFGVSLFFVLSSYLITSLLLREADATGCINVPAFWMRRVLRIWPLYFGFLGVYTALGGLTLGGLAAFSLFAGNWGVVYWGVNAGLATPLWSVSVEEQFYLAWPLVLAALPRRFLRPVCIGLIMTAVVARYELLLGGLRILDVWMHTLTHLDTIGAGALIALGPRIQLSPVARGVLSAVCVLGVIVSAEVVGYDTATPAGGSLAFLVVALSCGGLLLATLAGSAWLSTPVFVYLGRISYGLYVFHLTALGLVTGWWPWRVPVAFALTVAAAAVSHRFVEQPFLRLKARFTYVPSGGRT
jgi:peptidoglycan/LPS O-acetylase OafA/YrhL